MDDRPDGNEKSGESATGEAAAAGLGHQTGADRDTDRGHATGTGDHGDSRATADDRSGENFATDDVRADAEYADGGGDVRADQVGGLGRDTGSAGEGGPGAEGGLGTDGG